MGRQSALGIHRFFRVDDAVAQPRLVAETLEVCFQRKGMMHGAVTSDLACTQANLEGQAPCHSVAHKESAAPDVRVSLARDENTTIAHIVKERR
ncbi:hypothetical protein CIK59_02760 [Brevibacterium aurantiacum]|uniref:Uncharacterized protein n=1 Tax=Brevibacterium aurantiacum TaxID=273384 RepID=A0A2A3ZUB9_BREAU|nr:hypothetical protein CIK59_02760 [Brevibacterium aurantiacum]